MKVKPFNRKYDRLYITESTSQDDIAEFIKCPGAIKTRICGIGFAAKSYYQINLDCGIKEINVGDVILRNSFDEIAIMDSDTYSMIFKSDDN